MARLNIVVDVSSKGIKVTSSEVADLGTKAKKTAAEITGLKGAGDRLHGLMGKLGPAAAAAGVAIVGMVTRQAISNAIEQERVVAQLEAAIRSTGGAAGWTSEQLQKMASDLQSRSTFGDEPIVEAQSQLLTFTNIIDEQFPRAMQAVLDLAVRMGGDLKGSVVQLGKALNDPIANLSALSRSGIQFSESQKSVIKEMAETNRLAEAQDIILAELERQFGGSAEAARDTLGGAFTALGNSWGDLTELFVQDEAGKALRAFVEGANSLLGVLINNWGILRATVLEAAADIYDVGSNRIGAAFLNQMARQVTGISINIDPTVFEKTAAVLRERANKALDEWAGLTEEAADGTAKLTRTMPGLTDEAKKVADAVAKMGEDLRQRASDAQYLSLAAEEGSERFEVLARRLEAYNTVAKTGIDMSTKRAEALVEEAFQELELIDVYERKKEAALALADALDALFVARVQRVIEDRNGGPIEGAPQLGAVSIDDLLPPIEEISGWWTQFDQERREAFNEQLWQSSFDSLSRGLQGALSGALEDFFTDGTASFEDFFESIGKIGVSILSEVLAAQLSRQLMANLEGGGGGLQGYLNFLGSGQGAATTALVVGANIASAENAAYAAAGAALGAAVGAAFGGWAGAAFGAQVGSYLGGMIKHGTPEFFGAIEAELGKISIGESTFGGGLKVIGKGLGVDLADAMQDILDRLGGELESISSGLDLKMKDGKFSVAVDGMWVHFKEDFEAGMQFALLEAIQRSEISGVSPEVKQALEQSGATSLEKLFEHLDFARWFRGLELGQVGLEIEDEINALGTRLRTALELGFDLDPIIADGAQGFARWRNTLLGIQESQEERQRADRESYNRAVTLARLEHEQKKAELTVREAELRAETEILTAQLGITEARIEIWMLELDASEQMLSAEAEILYAKLEQLAATQRALQVISGILDALPDLIPDDAPLAGGGGGGKRQRREGREGIYDEVARFGLEGVRAELLDAQQFLGAFEESLKGLGFSAEEYAALMAQAGAEAGRRIAELRADVLGSVEAFINPGMLLQMKGFGEQAESLVSDLATLYDAGELAGDVAYELAERLREMAGEMRENLFAGSANEMLLSLYDLLGRQEDSAQLRYKVALAEYHIKIAELELAAQIYGLDLEVVAELKALVGEVEAAGWTLFLGSGGGGGGPEDQSGGYQQKLDAQYAAAAAAWKEAQDRLADAMSRLEGYESAAMSSFEREIARLEEDFAFIREELGDNLRVQKAYSAGLQAIIDGHLDPIRNLQRNLFFDPANTTASAEEQFQAALARARGLRDQFEGGDFSTLENIPEVIQTLMREALEYLPKGSGQYQDLFKEWNVFLNDVLALDTTGGSMADQAFAAELAAAVRESSRVEVAHLARIAGASEATRLASEAMRDDIAAIARELRFQNNFTRRVA